MPSSVGVFGPYRHGRRWRVVVRRQGHKTKNQAFLDPEEAFRYKDEQAAAIAHVARVNARRRNPPPAAGFVYFIQSEADGPIKIGFATNVRQRLNALRSGCPTALHLRGAIAGTLDTERELHKRFEDAWLRGEWHAPADSLLAYIAQHAQLPTPSPAPSPRS